MIIACKSGQAYQLTNLSVLALQRNRRHDHNNTTHVRAISVQAKQARRLQWERLRPRALR